MSGSGQVLYVANAGESIWKSSDSGTSWSALTSAGSRGWATIATSQDGSVVVAADNSSGSFYVSQDSGATWTQRSGANAGNWKSVVISNDGSKIKAITANQTNLYESDDYGATWRINSTLPTVLNPGTNPDGTGSSGGCYAHPNPCLIPNWAEVTMSGSANKIALLVSAPGQYESGRQLLISQDGGSTWTQTMGCCRDQSQGSQIASSRDDANWTIMMGNYQSSPGYLRYDEANASWARTILRVHERSGDSTNVYLTTWRGFAIAADGDQSIFTGQFYGWEPSHPGRYESLFTGAISTELAGVYHDETPGSYYTDVAISDSGQVRAALKNSTGEIAISTDSGANFSKIKIFELPLTPNIGGQIEYSDSYTVQVFNYDSNFTWSVSSTSGTASIDGSGLVTVLSPVGSSTLTVRTNKTNTPEGVGTFNAQDIYRPYLPDFGTHTEYLDSYTVQVDNYNPAYIWTVSVTSGTASIDSDGLITVANPVGATTLTVTTNRIGYQEGSRSNRYRSFTGIRTNAVWESIPGDVGMNLFDSGSIYDVAVNPVTGDIYVGGSFTNVNGDPDADYVMRFDGTNWLSLPGGFLTGSGQGSNGVFALAFDATGKLYAGGKFSDGGGDANADNLAQWDGTTWSAVGATSFNGNLRAIDILDDGRVLVGGQFTSAAGITGADYIAAWNGLAWSKLGTTLLNNYVRSITHSRNGGIYLGGFFTDLGGVVGASRVAQFVNGDWQGVGIPPTGNTQYNVPTAIAVDDSASTDKLYIGGNFYYPSFSEKLLMWDGQNWSAPSVGLNGDVRSLSYNRNFGLFIGGWFDSSTENRFISAMGLWADNVLYDIGDSNNDGTGVGKVVNCCVYSFAITSNNQIVIVGDFNTVAGVANTSRVARTSSWTPITLAPPVVSPPNTNNTSSALADARAAREAEIRKQEKIDEAFVNIIKNVKAGETITLGLAQDAELACFTSANSSFANSVLLGAPAESKTAITQIKAISEGLCILKDLTSARPQTISAREMVEFRLMPPNAYKPSLTLYRLKKLPLVSRSTYADIQVAIARIQSDLLASKKKLDARLRR